MPKQRYRVVLEQTDDGVLIGTIPTLNACYCSGRTLKELRSNLQAVIETRGEAPVPEEGKRPTGTRFAGVFDLEIEV